MARRFTLELIMDLASKIGANPAKAVSRSNISFLGKGPTKNPLFQNRLAGLENATEANLGKPETLFAAIDDAVGWAKDGKLNSIQTEILGHNLSGINKILNPPPLPKLPTASVTPIRSGIAGLTDTMPFGRTAPLTAEEIALLSKRKPFVPPERIPPRSEMEKLMKEGHTDARGRRWDFGAPKKNVEEVFFDHPRDPRLYKTPETGPERYNRLTGAGNYQGVLDQKTGMSRAIARNLLLKDTRLKLKPEELFMLKEGKGEPLDLMQKYYGRSISAYDDFLDNVNLEAARPDEFAEMILKNVKLIPQFAQGGLAEILQAPKMKHGGRIGFFQGALADTKEGKAMSPGTTASGGHRTGGDGQGNTEQTNLLPSPIVETGEADKMNFNKYISPSFTAKYSPAKAAMLRTRIYNQNLLESDDVNLEGSLSGTIGPVDYNTQFTDQGFGNTNLNYGNFSANIDPNKNYNLGYNTDINGWKLAANLGNENAGVTIGTKFKKGGLAGLLEV